MTTWTNEDGLLVRFNRERGEVAKDGVQANAPRQTFVMTIDSTDLPALADINDDRPSLPANAFVLSSHLVATSAWTGTGTLTLGLGDSAGSAIDADGIDAAIDVDTALAAVGDAVVNDGVLVDGTAAVGTARAWPYATASGSVSGTATLIIEYILT